jgi:hypothetical protein
MSSVIFIVIATHVFTEKKNDYRQFLEDIVENGDYGYGK